MMTYEWIFSGVVAESNKLPRQTSEVCWPCQGGSSDPS